MAILCVVAVRDSALGAFGRPAFVPTSQVAVRSFRDEVNRASPDNQMYNHPSDFELFELGTFEEETGRFTQLQDYRLLVRAVDLREA